MKAVLISSTPGALQVAFAAIRTCYSSAEFNTIWNDEFSTYSGRNNDHIRLVKQIVSHGHTSTLEHINFTFSIEGISRACLGQLTRHRHASYSVRSQRYTKIDEVVATPMDGNAIYQKAIAEAQVAYGLLLRAGFNAEDARMVLPNAAATNLIMTINLRSFMNFYAVRHLGTHAQKEIGELAEMMKDAIVAAEPWTESLFGV